MKKAVLALVVLILIVTASVVFVVRQGGVTDGAQLVPSDTVLFAVLPDLVQTANRWPATALAQIGAEEQMQAFLEKPLLALGGGGGADEAGAILGDLKPGRIFIAVTSVDESGGDMLVGFQFFGGRENYDKAINRMFDEMAKAAPEGVRSTTQLGGMDVLVFENDESRLYSVSAANWGFLSNDAKTIEDTVARVAGTAATDPLLANADYRKLRARLGDRPELIWFAQPESVVELLEKIGEDQDAEAKSAQFDSLKEIKSAAGSLTFEGALQKEVLYVITAGPAAMPKISGDGMRFTGPETVVYFERGLDWNLDGSSEILDVLPEEVRDVMQSAGIELDRLPEVFGEDFVLAIDWPSTAMVPGILAGVSVKDSQAAGNMVGGLMSQLAPTATARDHAGARIFGFPQMPIQLIDPAIAVSDDYLLAALTSARLESAITSQGGGLENSKAFAPALAVWQERPAGFGFINLGAIFERLYNSLRPIIIFGAAMSPDASKWIDVDKLPETATVSQHLGPVVIAQRTTDDGWMSESEGPLTLNQLILVVAGGAGASAAMQLLNPN